MNLVLDAGNTFTKAGIFIEGRLSGSAIIPSADFIHKKSIMQWIDRLAGKKPNAVILSSVNKSMDLPVDELREHYFFLYLDHSTPLPVVNGYKTPETLGFDRIAAAAGAVCLFPGSDILAIDAGTCITYEFIDRHKVYHGGAISPGIRMRYHCLHTMTNRLPMLGNTGKAPLTGKTTEESIHSGVLNGILSEVKGIIDTYINEYPGIKTVLTGGDMNYFEKNLKSDIFAAPNLVLIGLNYILEYNAGKN